MADVTEQSARLNTLMRFHQYADALPFAYKYRLDLQLSFPRSTQVDKALRAVEEIIDNLERQESRAKKVGKFLWGFIVNDLPGPPEDALASPGNTGESDAAQGSSSAQDSESGRQ